MVILAVIMAPYGLRGYLTGVAYRNGEPACQKLMDDWRHFFPADSLQVPAPPAGGQPNEADSPPISNFVEVVTGKLPKLPSVTHQLFGKKVSYPPT